MLRITYVVLQIVARVEAAAAVGGKTAFNRGGPMSGVCLLKGRGDLVSSSWIGSREGVEV